MNNEIKRIIEVTNELAEYGSTMGSTGECIAAAFILNDMEKLPARYDEVTEAWERLGNEWQGYVKQIKQEYSHLVQSAQES